MSRVGLLALGGGAYLAFLLASFPAATAYHWFAPEAVRLTGITGTVWSGQAMLGSVDRLALRQIDWRVRPLALVTGRLSGTLRSQLSDGFIQSDIDASFGGIDFSDLQLSASLATLAPLLPGAVRSTEGLISLSLGTLQIRDGWPVDAAGEFRLAELAVPPLGVARRSELITLGSFRLTFTETGGEGLLADVEDLNGPVEVDGSLQLGVDRTYRIEALVRPRPGAPAELTRGLDLMSGGPDAQGRRTFSLEGSL